VSGAFVRETLRGLVPLGFRFEVIVPASAAPGAAVPEPGIVVRETPHPGFRLRGGLAHSRGIPETLAAQPWKWALVPGLARSLERAAARALEESGCDLVWSHWLLPCGAIGARLARRHGVPHLATAHGADVRLLERLARVPGARAALRALWEESARVAPAARTARRVGDSLGRTDVGVAPLPSCVTPSEPAAGPPRLLFLGRFEPIKGPDLLLEAMALLPRGLFRDLTLAGAGSLEPALRERAARLALPVRFAGVVEGERKAWALAAAHAVVVPSRRLRCGRGEGLPQAAVESLAAGRPFVAPREGALADLASESGAGVLYDAPAGDGGRVRALAGALLDLGSQAERLRDLCARARVAGERFRSPQALNPWREHLVRAAGGCA
jgi:glycosyltransferase involved in cell wall biosynthesis